MELVTCHEVLELHSTPLHAQQAMINSMKQSPFSEANSVSSNQKIRRLLRKPKVYYCVRRNSHIFVTYFLKIYFNIILPSTLTSPKWSFPLSFSD